MTDPLKHRSKDGDIPPVDSGVLPWRKRLRRRIPDQFIDWLWPSERPLSANEERREAEKRADSEGKINRRLSFWDKLTEERLLEVLAQSRRLLESERQRQLSVHSRLGIVQGMAAVAMSVTVAAAGFVLPMPAVQGGNLVNLGLVTLTLLIGVQFARAVVAATKGVGRVGIRAPQPYEALPEEGENRRAYLRRVVQFNLYEILDLRESTNVAVTQMALAHRALTNACVFIGLTIVVLAIATFA